VHALRIWFVSALGAGLLAVSGSCYQQPEIPRDRPLSCSSDDPAECPSGFVCIEKRICAPEDCETDEDCPLGLACGRMGCALPGIADGGADVGGGS
jgi:hypothetical protein